VTKIYYFSGTGNSLWSAKRIAELSGGECELFNIGVEAGKGGVTIEADAVVLVFPAYAYGLPLIVRRFVKSAVFKTSYAAAFVTYGSSPGGALAAMCRLLKKKNINALFFGRIPAPENYLAIFGPQSAEKVESRVSMQQKATEEAAHSITERKTNRINTFRPFSGFVSFLFSLGAKIFYKHYRLGNCNGCGTCEKICPVSAIVMRDGHPVFSNKCENCQGCVDMCPSRAIQFGRVKFGAPGYRHPSVSIKELSSASEALPR
jgi:ferredoxin